MSKKLLHTTSNSSQFLKDSLEPFNKTNQKRKKTVDFWLRTPEKREFYRIAASS